MKIHDVIYVKLFSINLYSINTYDFLWYGITLQIGCLIKALFSKSEMNTPESCSFWVTDTGNISFSTQIHCFHQVLASWLSSISLLEMKIFLLTTPPCHTSKVASWHVDCRYELHFWSYLGKILSKSPKTGEIWHYCSNHNFLHVFQLLPNILPR